MPEFISRPATAKKIKEAQRPFNYFFHGIKCAKGFNREIVGNIVFKVPTRTEVAFLSGWSVFLGIAVAYVFLNLAH